MLQFATLLVGKFARASARALPLARVEAWALACHWAELSGATMPACRGGEVSK